VRLLYKPIGIILGILAGIIGRKLFEFVWTKVSDEEPAEATKELASWSNVIGAAAVQGVIFRVTRVIVDRYGAIGWSYLTGAWPGERRPDPDE
jgi:Protein of unknown function (DUF4235)